jgi:cytochrome c oxidase subunit II
VDADSAHLRRVLTIWVMLSIVGVAFVLLAVPHILPQAGSDTESFANTTIVLFTAIAIPVAFFVWVFLAYSLVVFRVREQPIEDGPPLQPTPMTQVGWLSITGALCIISVVWGLIGVYDQTVASSAGALDVRVTGQQWTWTYDYPQYGVSSHELVLPLQRPVQFSVTSMDVLHGFEVLQLGVRMDANPGQVVAVSVVTPSRLGSYTARCMELCGLYHSYMQTPVNVVTSGAFTDWVKQHGGHV